MHTTCPCCRQKVSEKELQKVETLFPFLFLPRPADRKVFSWIEVFMTVVNRAPEYYQWACDDCLQEGKAILANPNKQLHNFWSSPATGNPYLAYFNENRKCENCGEQYVFGMAEQLHWYEELQFVVFSRPKQCPECRKKDRTARNLNTELSELLRNGKPDNPEALERIGAIYKLMGKEEKEKAYSRAAEKLRRE